jgi:hypothetical protein
LTDRIEVANQITGEVTLGVEVIGQEKLAQNLPAEPFKERNYLTKRTGTMTRDDRGNKLRIIGVVKIQRPEIFREMKVPAPKIPTMRKARNSSRELSMFVSIPLYIRLYAIANLGHQGANILHRQLAHRCLALNHFLLRQLSHLL